MVEYICQRCGHKTNKKSAIKSHYNRKKPCITVYNNIPLAECLKLLDNPTYEINEIKEENKLLKKQLELAQNKIKELTNTYNFNITTLNDDCNYNILQEKIVKCIEDSNISNKLVHFNKENILYRCKYNTFDTFNGDNEGTYKCEFSKLT